MEVGQRQKILRLLVKEILIGRETVTIRHSIPTPHSGGGPDGSSGTDSHAAEFAFQRRLSFAFSASLPLLGEFREVRREYVRFIQELSPLSELSSIRMTRRELLIYGVALAASVSSAAGGHHSMEQRVSIVTLGVKDLGTARRFYIEGLGWNPIFENEEIVFFQTGGMVFALFLREKLAEDFRADPAAFGRAAMALGYNVRAKSEVDPLLQRAANAGAAILKPAREASWGGYSGYFADPDGFAWEVAWNPAWHLAADGSIYVR